MTIKYSEQGLNAALRVGEPISILISTSFKRMMKICMTLSLVGTLAACDQAPSTQEIAGDDDKTEATTETDTITDTEIPANSETEPDADNNSDNKADIDYANCVAEANATQLAEAQTQFDAQCVLCHTGSSAVTNPNNLDLQGLTAYIHDTMPFGNTTACENDCADDIARLLLNLDFPIPDHCIIAKTEDEGENENNSDNETDANTETDSDSDTDDNSDSDSDTDTEQDSETDTDNGAETDEEICDENIAAGKEQFKQHCSTCHFGNSQVANASGRSLAELTEYISINMPSGTPSYCEDDCAAQTAAYIEFFLNPEERQSCEIEETQPEIVGNLFTRRTTAESLYRTTMSLVGRIPTAAERQTVEVQGEEGLSSIIDALMEEEAFLNRMAEFYNELIHTDFYARNSHKPWLLQWFSWNFSEALWFDRDENLLTADKSILKQFTAEGIGREPVELVKYVVKNNRPISEILTANYFMVNAYSARSYYGLYEANQNNFTKLNSSVVESSEYLEHPDHFIPVQLPLTRAADFPPGSFQGGVNGTIQHAGILTSPMFLQKFPTTETNLNRHRSAHVFKLFLDLDIEALPGLRPGDAEDSGPNPTMNNDACKGCHELMDPVASAFAVFRTNTRYSPEETWFPSTEFRPAGFRGTAMPLVNNAIDYEGALPWLAQQIVQDPGFLTATVRTLYSGLFGMEKIYKRSGETLTDEEQALYDIQQAYFSHWENVLSSNNMNIKPLIKAMITSDWYQGNGLKKETAAESLLRIRPLLTPEMLDRKMSSLVDLGTVSHQTMLAKYSKLSIGYGGIDDQDSNLRILDQNGLMGTVQDYLPNAYACSIIVRDYERAVENANRKYVYKDTNVLPVENRVLMVRDPHSRLEEDIRVNIQNMIYVLHGRELATDHQEVNELYELFSKVIDTENDITSNQYIRCVAPYKIGGDAFGDKDSSVGAYMAVLTVIMKNFNFFYE